MIKIENLTKSFGELSVLKNINSVFKTQNIHGIVGLNGSGKTTFFNCLSGRLKQTAGSIWLDAAVLHKREIAYLETTNFFYKNITGKEYLNLFQQTNSKYDLDTLQRFMQLPLDQLIEQYSTGMKKKLALAGILKKDKPVYLFDEVFNGVDMQAAKLIEEIVLQLKSAGKTVFISSHILAPMLNICDQIHFLQDGVFTKSFEKENFDQIEDDLLGRYVENLKESLTGNI